MFERMRKNRWASRILDHMDIWTMTDFSINSLYRLFIISTDNYNKVHQVIITVYMLGIFHTPKLSYLLAYLLDGNNNFEAQ